MPDLKDETLQRLFDEDLDPSERSEARSTLAQSPDDQRRIEALTQMRGLLRAGAEAAADEADLDDIWPAVQARIAADRPVSTWELLTAWLGRSLGAHPLRWAAAGVCTVALAVLLGMLISASQGRLGTPAKPVGEARVEPPGEDKLDIERIEFKNRHPDIFRIKDGKRTTTVIWIYPDEDEDDEDGADTDDGNGGGGPI